jgi:hypothetical protein
MILELDEVLPGYSLSTIRSNFDKIEQFLAYYVIRREVDAGEPNEMRTDLVFAPGFGIVIGDGAVCTLHADIMLVIDNTGSNLKTTYESEAKPAMAAMVQELIDLGRDVTMGMIRIRQGVMEIQLPLSADLTLTRDAITALPEPGDNTNLAVPITAAKEELDLNGREGVPGVIIIITDGIPNIITNPYGSFNESVAIIEGNVAATAAKDAGYRMVVFGMTAINLALQTGGGGG